MEQRTLYRSRRDRMLGGVCGGVAEYFDFDPTIVRLVAVLLVVIGNAAAVIVYIVMWIAVPEDPLGTSAVQDHGRDSTMTGEKDRPAATYTSPSSPPEQRGRGGAWLGAALVFVGVVLLVQMFVPGIRLWEYWPVIIIIAGVLMIVRPGRGDAR